MQRILDPAQIEAFATQRAIPRVRLPDPATLFSSRAQRLRKLSEGHAVGDYLRLMATLADAQQTALDLTAQVGERDTSEPRMRQAQAHGMPLLQADGWPRNAHWRVILRDLTKSIAAAPGFPEAVAAVCRRIQAMSVQQLEEQADLLLMSAANGVEPQAAPFVMAALQVHWVRMLGSLSVEEVAEHVGGVDLPGVCPVCGTLPVASIVRADKAYQGYRYLHCALCATEWHLVRIKCSQCGTTEGIHYHSIEGGSPAIRAETCDGCRTYRKIFYQEHDTEVEPLADDLGSLALDLLVSEAGFHRGSGNPLLWQAAETPGER